MRLCYLLNIVYICIKLYKSFLNINLKFIINSMKDGIYVILT